MRVAFSATASVLCALAPLLIKDRHPSGKSSFTSVLVPSWSVWNLSLTKCASVSRTCVDDSEVD